MERESALYGISYSRAFRFRLFDPSNFAPFPSLRFLSDLRRTTLCDTFTLEHYFELHQGQSSSKERVDQSGKGRELVGFD